MIENATNLITQSEVIAIRSIINCLSEPYAMHILLIALLIVAAILVRWLIKMQQNTDNITSRSSNSTISLTIIAFVISFIFLIILIFLKLDYTDTEDGVFYLLSSISQGLAATFAILFTLLILEAQIASKYSSYLIESIFGKLTLGYMVLFIIAIIMPLICLRHMNVFLLEFSFFIAVLCLTLIVPFLISVKDKFNPTTLINENCHLAVKAIKKSCILKEPKKEVSVKDKFNLTTLINENCRLAVKAIKKRAIKKSGFFIEPKKDMKYIVSKIKAIGDIARISMLEEDYSVYYDGVKALEKIELEYKEYKPTECDFAESFKEQGYIPSWQDFIVEDEDLNKLYFDVTLFKELFSLFDVAHFKSTTPYQSTTLIIKVFGNIGSKVLERNSFCPDDSLFVKEVFGCLNEAGQRGVTVSKDRRIADQAFRELENLIEIIKRKENEKEKWEELIKIGCKDLFMLGVRCYYGCEITHYYNTSEWYTYSLGKDYSKFLTPLLKKYDVVNFIIKFGKKNDLWTNIESCTYRYFGLDPPKRFKEFEIILRDYCTSQKDLYC